MGDEPSSAEKLSEEIDLQQELMNLARGYKHDITPYLEEYEFDFKINDTLARSHTYFLTLGPDGLPRIRDFVKSLVNHILDYAIPRKDIQEAADDYKKSGSSHKILNLRDEARNLFVDLLKTGEGGELILFVLTERILKFPQIFSKMVLKTNSKLHFHGADGIYVSATENDEHVNLYWGESKLNKSSNTAIKDCIESISPYFKPDEMEGRRDMQLIVRNVDFNNKNIEKAATYYLDPSKEGYKKLKFCGVCLAGFDFKHYPSTANEKNIDDIKKEINKNIPGWKSKLEDTIKSEALDTFDIHMFYLPFPSVEDFRKRFLVSLGVPS